MSLGLSHSLSRYKLKFSPDKVSASTGTIVCVWSVSTRRCRMELQA